MYLFHTEHSSEFWFAVGNALWGLLGGLMIWILREIRQLPKQWRKMQQEYGETDVPLEFTHKKDIEINVVLNEALYRFGAMRVFLSKFHNGEKFSDGSGIFKKSRTHERVAPGISYQADQFQNVLMTTVPEESVLIIEEGPGWARVEDLPESRFKALCLRGGVKAVARVEVRILGRLVGFLGFDFSTEIKPEDLADLKIYASRIALVLMDLAPTTFPGMKPTHRVVSIRRRLRGFFQSNQVFYAY